MRSLWEKPTFLIVLLLLLMIAIPSFIYIFKSQILSSIANISNRTKNQQTLKSGTCLTLPEKYCSQGEVVYIKNSLGETGAYIGFNLPVGTPIFAGKTGLALKAEIKQPHPLQGFLVSIRDSNGATPNSTAVDAVGDLKLDNMLSLDVNEGDIIARIQNTGVKVFEKFNFVTTISRFDSQNKRAQTDEQKLKALFPAIRQ